MKKFFSLFVAAFMAAAVSATTTTFTFNSVNKQNKDGFTIVLDKANGLNAPAYQDSWPAPRLYAQNTITISGKSITAISIKFAKGNNTKGYASASANVGTYTSGGDAASSADYKTDTWSGNAASVTITLGDAGQRSLFEITVTGEGLEGGDEPTVDDGAITDLHYCDAYYYTEGEYEFYDFDLYKNLTNDYSYVYPEIYIMVEAKKKTAINGTYDIYYAGYWMSANDSIETDLDNPVGTLTIRSIDNDGQYNLSGSFVGTDNKTYTFNTTLDVLAYDADDEDYQDINLEEDNTAVTDIVSDQATVTKIIRNHQLIIRRNGTEYNAQGAIIR